MTTGHDQDTEHTAAPTPPDGPEVIQRRKFLKTVGAATAVGVAGATAITYYAVKSNNVATSLVCGYRSGEIPLDPASGVWTRRAAFRAPLLKQNMATPNAIELAVPEVRVRALHNGKEVAFHLEWAAPEKSELDAIARFHDAVAVMLGTDPATDAPITMGGQNTPAHILQWKASWQADIDRGQQTVKDAFPNMYNDVIPEQWMPAEQAKVFYPAWAVGNALAQRDKKTPIEELSAVGFGTLTTHKEQETNGRGVHDGRRWRVVMVRPLKATGTNKATITPGETRGVAFAVWSGIKSQRGARKQYAIWTPMEIEAGS